MARVVIAGSGHLGQRLAEVLGPSYDVRGVRMSGPLPASTGQLTWCHADLTSLHGAEIALSGAQTVVMLAQARRPMGRFQRASLEDVDRLLADSVTRAARLVDVKHLVLFACGESDARLPLFEMSNLPLSVLRGGGPDPVEHLAAMVRAGPGAQSLETPEWTAASPGQRIPRFPTCSIQRYQKPAQWSALDVARAYFKWLPSDVPLTRTSERAGTFTIHFGGARLLVLRLVPGRSSEDCAYFEIADGALAGRSATESRFEFRALLDGTTVLSALVGYQSSIPSRLYRFSQALLHERTMRHFGEWLLQQQGAPP